MKQIGFQMEDGESRAESPVLEKKASESHCSTFQIVLSIVVILLAIGGSYLFTMTEENVEEIVKAPTPEAADFEEDAQFPS